MASHVVHFEIPAEDTGRARSFFGELFGWSFESQPGTTEYWVADTGEEPGVGLLPRAGRERNVLLYFDVDDVEAAAARVEQLGGKIVVPKTRVENKGWLAKFEDTEGNLFGLWMWDHSA